MRNSKTRTNREIRFRSDIRLIDEGGDLIGTMPVREALSIAEEKNLDLVEISPHARPPVCKIMDYGKFLYDTKKAIKKQKGPALKEIKFRPNTEKNDILTKTEQIKKFLSRGDRVQTVVRFKGRQNAHPEVGMNLLIAVKELIEREMDAVKFSIKKADRSIIMMIERSSTWKQQEI
jgi:translation initiation factor IF-3